MSDWKWQDDPIVESPEQTPKWDWQNDPVVESATATDPQTQAAYAKYGLGPDGQPRERSLMKDWRFGFGQSDSEPLRKIWDLHPEDREFVEKYLPAPQADKDRRKLAAGTAYIADDGSLRTRGKGIAPDAPATLEQVLTPAYKEEQRGHFAGTSFYDTQFRPAVVAGGTGVVSPLLRATGFGDTATRLQSRSAALGELAEESAREQTQYPILPRAARGVVSSLPIMMAGGTAGPYGALGAAAVSEGDSAYHEARLAGESTTDAMQYAADQAAIEFAVGGMFQKLGLGGLEQTFGESAAAAIKGGVRQALKQAGIRTAQEIPEELITAFGHAFRSKQIKPEAMSAENLWQTGFDTLAQTLLMGGVVHAPQIIGAAIAPPGQDSPTEPVLPPQSGEVEQRTGPPPIDLPRETVTEPVPPPPQRWKTRPTDNERQAAVRGLQSTTALFSDSTPGIAETTDFTPAQESDPEADFAAALAQLPDEAPQEIEPQYQAPPEPVSPPSETPVVSEARPGEREVGADEILQPGAQVRLDVTSGKSYTTQPRAAVSKVPKPKKRFLPESPNAPTPEVQPEAVPQAQAQAQEEAVPETTQIPDRAVEYSSPAVGGRRSGAVLHQSAKNKGQWQVTYFDEDGFSGDNQYKSRDKAVEELAQHGYTKGGALLDEVSPTERFSKGNEKTQLIALMNEGADHKTIMDAYDKGGLDAARAALPEAKRVYAEWSKKASAEGAAQRKQWDEVQAAKKPAKSGQVEAAKPTESAAKPAEPAQTGQTPPEVGPPTSYNIQRSPKGWSISNLSDQIYNAIPKSERPRKLPAGRYFSRTDPTAILAEADRAVAEKARRHAALKADGRAETSFGLVVRASHAETAEAEFAERLKLATDEAVRRNDGIRELLGRSAGLTKIRIRRAMEKSDPDSVRGFDELVDFAINHPEYGLPTDESKLAHLLANYSPTIDLDALRDQVAQEMASEYESFVDQAEQELSEIADDEDGGDDSFDFGAAAETQQTAIPGFEQEAAAISATERNRERKPLADKPATQRAFISGLGKDLPGQETMFDVDGLDGGEEGGSKEAPPPPKPSPTPAVPSNKGPVSESRFKNDLWQEHFTKAKVGEYFSAQTITRSTPPSYSPYGIYFKSSKTEAVIIENQNYLTEPKKEVAALSAGKPKTKIQESADKARQELRDAIDEFGKASQGKVLSGLDPQLAALATKVVAKAIKAGVRTVQEVIENLRVKYGDAMARKGAKYIEQAWRDAHAATGKPSPAKSDDAAVEATVEEVTPPPVQPPPAKPPVPPTEPLPSDDTTGPKNVKTDELRRKAGMEERPPVEPKESVEQWQADASKRMKDPLYAGNLAEELAANPRAIDQVEQAVLGRLLRELENRRKAGEDVSDELRTAVEASERVGTIWGRAGVSRQVELTADFSVEGIIRQHLRSVNKTPTDAEMEKYSELADRIAKLEGELSESQKKLAQAEVDRQIAEAKAESNKPTPAPKTGRRKAAEKRVADAWEKFRKAMTVPSSSGAAMIDPAIEVAKAYWELGVVRFSEFMAAVRQNVKDPDEKLFREAWKQAAPDSDINDRAAIGTLARQLTRAVVESGITEREAVIDAVHEELANMGIEVSRSDTMAAMSGYGDFRELSKDEVSVKVRGIRGEIQQLLKLEDMQAGEAPKKTGVERREPTDEERRLIKQVNEAKKKGGYIVTDPERQLKSAMSTAKTAARNRIADLDNAIAKRERIVTGQTKLAPDAELAALRKQRDELNAEYLKIFPPKKTLVSDAQRLKMAEKMLDRQIAELKADLAAGKLDPKAKGQPLSSPEIESKKLQLELLNAAREQARAASPEYQAKQAAKQNARYKKSLEKLLGVWQARLSEAERGILPKKRKKTPVDTEILEKKFQIEQVKRETRVVIEDAERANRSRTGKALGFGGDLLDLSQAIMTGYEMSAVLRQGAYYTFGFPRQAFPAIWKSIGAAFSRRADFAIHDDLLQRANHLDYMQGGLETTATDGPLSHREELIRSRLASWLAKQQGTAWALPRWAAEGLLGGERGFRSFTNTMRADLFDYMKASVEASRPGTWSEDDAKVLGGASNIFSGRGELPGGMTGAGWGRVFFAPRWVWSRGQLLVGQPLWRGDSATRMAVGQVYVRAAIGFAAYQLIKHAIYWLTADDDEHKPKWEVNPLSSDFNKMRIGETRIDSGAGLNQLIVLVARAARGKTKLASGKVVPIRGDDVPYGADDGRDVVHRFLDSKLAPLPSGVLDWVAGKNVVGEKATVGSIVAERTRPMTWHDIWRAEQELNVPQGTVAAIEAFFGEGVTTYGPRTKQRAASK